MELEIKIIDYQGKELSKDEIKDRIEELRKLLIADEKLKKLRTDDTFVLRFLFPTNFYVKKAYETAKALYKYCEEEWDWLPTSPVEEMKKFADMNMRFILPFTDRKGKRLVLCKADTIQPSKLTLTDLMKYENTLLEYLFDDPSVQANGLVFIMDVHGTSWSQLSWFTPRNVKRIAKKLDNIAVKDVEFHIVRTTTFMNAILKVTMPFLPQKIKKRMLFHYDDFDSFHKHISPECLPKEFGGTYNVNYEELNEEFWSQRKLINQKLEMYKVFLK